MSMNTSVYVGAYLLVPTTLLNKATEHVECSANCGERSAPKDGRFCVACGAPLRTVSNPSTVVKHWHCHELGSDHEDLFFSPESSRSQHFSLWLPNQRLEGASYAQEDTRVDHLVAMPEDYVARQRSAFRALYGAALETIEERFHVKPVLQVGVVPYSA